MNLLILLLWSEIVIQSSSDFLVVTAHISETPSAAIQYLEFSEDTGILRWHWVSLQSSSFCMYILVVVCMEKNEQTNKQWKCVAPFNLFPSPKSPCLYQSNTRRKHIYDKCWTSLKIVLISNNKSVCYFDTAWCYVSIKMFFIEVTNLKTQRAGMFTVSC